jgi:DNA primase
MKKHTIDFNTVKRRLSPFDLYRHELPNAALKKRGWNDGGLCPFHADTQHGSFRVNTDTGAFKCYSCGTKGGDVIALCMALYGLNFTDALAKLADDWGLS